MESEVVGGAVYTNITHDYSPYFAISGDNFLNLGDTFQDILSDFPFASTATTAEWLNITTTDPDGNSATFTRVLKDQIGLDKRPTRWQPEFYPARR